MRSSSVLIFLQMAVSVLYLKMREVSTELWSNQVRSPYFILEDYDVKKWSLHVLCAIFRKRKGGDLLRCTLA